MNKPRHNIADVKAMARGRWLDIVPALDSRFAGMVGDKGTANNHYGCPVHGGVDGFRFLSDAPETGAGVCNTCGTFRDGFELLQWSCGWSLPWALHQVYSHLNGSPVDQGRGRVEYVSPVKKKKHRNIDAMVNVIRKQWGDSVAEQHEPARLYYQNRGLSAVPVSPSIRYHAGIPFYVRGKPIVDDRGKWITWPAIVAAIRSRGGLEGLQRIYLTKIGAKAEPEIRAAILKYCDKSALEADIDCKPIITRDGTNGGAVRFGASGSVLGVGEGLETMLAVQQLTGSTSLAAGCTTNILTGIDIPSDVEKLVIFADKDRNRAGLNAAETLKARVLADQENRVTEVEIKLPDLDIPDGAKGVDWLDWLNFHGTVSLNTLMCLE